MSTKRQPSKQKRQAQNRAQRAALEARRAAAQSAGASGGSTRSGGSGGGLFSRLRGGASAPRPSSTGGRGRRSAATDLPVGHRAALSGLLAALAALFAVGFLLRVPVDADDQIYTPLSRVAEWTGTIASQLADDPEASPADVVAAIDEWSPNASSKTAAVAYWPFSLTFILPVIGAAIGLRAVSKRASARSVNRAVFATLFGALLTQGLFLLFLPAVISLAVAAFQIRKRELAEAREAMADGDAASGVIEADAVEGDVLDDDELNDDPDAGRLTGDDDVAIVDAAEGFDTDLDSSTPPAGEVEWAEGEHPPK